MLELEHAKEDRVGLEERLSDCFRQLEQEKKKAIECEKEVEEQKKQLRRTESISFRETVVKESPLGPVFSPRQGHVFRSKSTVPESVPVRPPDDTSAPARREEIVFAVSTEEAQGEIVETCSVLEGSDAGEVVDSNGGQNDNSNRDAG